MKYLSLTLRILVFLFLVLLFSSLFFSLGYACLPVVPSASLVPHFLSSLSLLAAVLPASFLLMRMWEKVPFRVIGFPRRGWLPEVWQGALTAFLIYLFGFGLSLLLGAVSVAGVAFFPSELFLSWLLMLSVALGEELMMRGFVLGSLLRAGVNRYWALCLSSLLFALFHVANPSFTLFSLVNILLAGLLLGSTYIYTRSLWYPISLHLFWNWLQGPVLGYEVSGNVFGHSLLLLRRTDAVWLNGGPFGFEASLICTFLLLLFLLSHLLKYRTSHLHQNMEERDA